ncbi:chitin synthase chs-1-like [Pelmatolapia mariae]|uniref:chitin synthase chs-1-like n=1 Tax=Pelmatolapia mariae TaxID=158779 RepID=UPI003211D5FF
MEEQRDLPKRPWDTCQEVPIIEDEQTPWKMIKLLKMISLFAVAFIVFGSALCSKTSFLLLITLSNEGTKTLPPEQKPVALLCIGCSLIASSVLFFEFLVSAGASILTIMAMPHLDIVTNVTIFNGVAVISAILQLVAQCSAKQTKHFLMPCIFGLIFILIGYVLFVLLYIMKDSSDNKMIIWVGLAVGGSILVSFNWWENYFQIISDNSSSTFLGNLCKDITKCQNILQIFSSFIRIVVTACVIGAYVPLAKMDWSILTSIPSRETSIIAIIIGVQLVSSAVCHWFALVACKMHALRRCFILPLYLASLAVLALLVIPVIVYYQDYRASLNGTANINFTDYCKVAVDGRNQNLKDSVLPCMVLDVTYTLCFLDMSKIADIGILTGTALFWWIGLVLVTLHLWKLNVHRIQRTQDLFIRRLYEGAFIEQSLLLNTRFDIHTKETIRKLDKYRPKEDPKINDFTFEAQIYFDDAFEHVEESCHLNEYAKNLVQVIQEVYGIFKNAEQKFFRKKQQVPDQKIIQTPYGGRLIVNMPQGNNIVVHFKDKERIRHKKRWSQIMYLYYLLGWKLMTKYYIQKHNTYILALDGDTDFQPASLMLLIDRLRIYPCVGAACGRIHPTGSGPAVWFQKFEYALSHWLQKTAEHVIGCVLCSPGCFSLFRAEALMDDNVMKTYSTKSTEARHYIQYDQGEDRWLCTLLLKQGWRVEYNAASDAHTNAPMDFKELYHQRRRWGASTMANMVDLLGSTKIISKRNPSISKPFMFYQFFGMISAILAPATICLLIAGSLSFVLNINSAAALVISVIPPAIYLGLCFKLKSDTQITIAAILGVCYAFLMLLVTISIIGSMVKAKTILTPSSILIISMSIIYIITAAIHPQEFHLLFYSFPYIICIPSAYLLLTIYSMANMNNVSWGTRETKPAAGTAPPPALTPQMKTQKAKGIFQQLFSWVKCCKKVSQGIQVDQLSGSQDNTAQEPEQLEAENTIVENITITEAEQGQLKRNIQSGWIEKLQSLSSDLTFEEDSLDQEEKKFWEELQKKYLEPLPDDKENQKKMANELRDLRNKVNFVFFMLNAFWLVATFILQLFSDTLSIKIPKLNIQFQKTGDDIQIDPIAFMFILGFAVSVVIQFLAMLYHRIHTLIHYVAIVDTEPKAMKKLEKQKSYLQGKRHSSSSNADSSYSSMKDFETEDSDVESEVTRKAHEEDAV